MGVRLTDGKDREGAEDLGNDLDLLGLAPSPSDHGGHGKHHHGHDHRWIDIFTIGKMAYELSEMCALLKRSELSFNHSERQMPYRRRISNYLFTVMVTMEGTVIMGNLNRSRD